MKCAFVPGLFFAYTRIFFSPFVTDVPLTDAGISVISNETGFKSVSFFYLLPPEHFLFFNNLLAHIVNASLVSQFTIRHTSENPERNFSPLLFCVTHIAAAVSF